MMVKYLNWKLTREAESFQTAAAACGRSSRSLMSTRGKHWLTETKSHPHVHNWARNVQLGSYTCFKLLREESQAGIEVANRYQQVVSGTYPPLVYGHFFLHNWSSTCRTTTSGDKCPTFWPSGGEHGINSDQLSSRLRRSSDGERVWPQEAPCCLVFCVDESQFQTCWRH